MSANKLNIDSVPQPFREFLGSTNEKDKEQDMSAMGMETEGRDNQSKDMQDLLFLAAILMLCDD